MMDMNELAKDVDVSMVRVRPSDATRILEGNKINRPFIDSNCNQMCIDRRNNDWVMSSSLIMVCDTGDLINGQHTLTMVVRTGMPTWLAVAENVPIECMMMIDQNRTRSTVDAINLSGTMGERTVSQDHISILNMLVNLDDSITRSASSKKVLSRYLKFHWDAIDFTVEAFKGAGVGRVAGLFTSPIMAAVACAYYHPNKVRENRLVHFCEILMTGAFSVHGDGAVRSLRDWCLRNSNANRGGTGRKSVTMRTFSAISNYIAGKEPSRLIPCKINPFPIPEFQG